MESAERVQADERSSRSSGSPLTVTVPDEAAGRRVVLCPHISLEHYRGGEKWTARLANRLAADGVDVSIRALPYLPGNRRRVDVHEVLDDDVSYREAWRHDLSAFDTAYVFYHPLSQLFFSGDAALIAGIHSWVYVSDRLYESHYGLVPTLTKLLYRAIGSRDLRQFDLVHSVTPAFDCDHPNLVHVPNFVDAERFHPDRAPLSEPFPTDGEPTSEKFTVLVTAAHIRQKGWDAVREVAARLPEDIRLAATGTSDDPNVEDLGFLDEDELARAYASAHVVLHPARVDTDSMVINEATASGTPVVTTPLPTHVRENEAILHARTPAEMVGLIRLLHREWERDAGYEQRCRLARSTGEQHDVRRIYPQLKELLFAPEAVAQ